MHMHYDIMFKHMIFLKATQKNLYIYKNIMLTNAGSTS